VSITFYYRLSVNERHLLLHGLCALRSHILTGQVEERGVVLERCESERQIGLGGVGVLECVPEGSAGVEQLAANFLVVALRVLDGGYGGARDGAN
jgi:hypothetical protein